MAYNSVGTPRFYVDHGLWMHSLGIENFYYIDPNYGLTYEMLLLNPSVQRNIVVTGAGDDGDFAHIKIDRVAPINYIAVLGHRCDRIYPEFYSGDDSTLPSNLDSVINGGIGSTGTYPGFTIATFNDVSNYSQAGIVIQEGSQLNAVSIGSYYDMPHSPDLSLTMEREYGGTKTIETKGGASLSNSFYNKPPKWGALGAWELDWTLNDYYQNTELSIPAASYSQTGRRIWSLSFSYLDQRDVFGANPHLIGGPPWDVQTTPPYNADDLTDVGFLNTDLLTNDNFFSQVIHKTLGGQLPFIFQPNTSDTNDINFALCKLDMESFKFDQVANGVYNIKLKIREVW